MRREQKMKAAATLLCSLSIASAWFVGPPTSAASSHRHFDSTTSRLSSPPFSCAQRRRRNAARGEAADRSTTSGSIRGRRRAAAARTSHRMVGSSMNWEWGRAKSSGDAPTPAAQAFGSGQELKLGVLLLNLGGPERPEDVQPFLFNLFADPDIIRLPKVVRWLQNPIAAVLAARRAPQSKSAYESIGGGSPIVSWTNAQAKGIASQLEAKGLSGTKCYVGMRYWHPFTEAALEAIEDDEINALVILPLYPQFSISTSGSSLRILNEEFTRRPEQWGHKNVVHTVVPSYHDRPGYVNAMASLIAREVAEYTPEQRMQGVQVLFSAHGVPKSYIDAGDPYKAQIESCVKLISEKVDGINAEGGPGAKPGSSGAAAGGVTYHLSYQSRVGPVEWLQPYTDAKIHELADNGCKNLVVVPVSFVSEHIETLEEIDMEYREVAEEAGITNWRRVPALNTDPAFIEDMADMVVEALALPTLTVSEAFTRNNCDRKEAEGFLEKALDGMYGMPKTGGKPPKSGKVGGAGAAGANASSSGGEAGGGGADGEASGDKREEAARVLSTLSGAAFAADGVGREIAGLFTATSDGIFF
ncbi:unnamed protein product [Ectocarpus sp. 12 AP-2014]